MDKMTKSAYVARATAYYVKRYTAHNSRRKWKPDTILFEAAVAFSMAEAAIKSIAPGRQNSRTLGWDEAGLRAHQRAAARIR